MIQEEEEEEKEEASMSLPSCISLVNQFLNVFIAGHQMTRQIYDTETKIKNSFLVKINAWLMRINQSLWRLNERKDCAEEIDGRDAQKDSDIFCVFFLHLLLSITDVHLIWLAETVLGQNGIGQNGTDKMVTIKSSISLPIQLPLTMWFFHQSRFHFNPFRFPLCVYHVLVTFAY